MKQLYVADPSEHKLLVNEANRPGTLSNILGSVLGMLLGFHRKQNNASHSTKEIEEQAQATPEASTIDTTSTIDSLNSGKTPKEGNDIYTTHGSDISPIQTKTVLRTHCAHNEMLSHYNHIVIGSFEGIFQMVDTNNLPAVLQVLKELNFILTNRASELPAHYGFPLEPQQVSAKEVPDFVSAYLQRPTANSAEHNSGGRPRTRGNQQYRPSRQSLPVPRYNRQTNRSDAYPHFNRARSSYQSRYSDRDRHHSYSSSKYQHPHNQASHSYHNNSNTPNMYPLNTSELIGSLQSQIIGLQLQPLQQSTLNSIKKHLMAPTKLNLLHGHRSIEQCCKIVQLRCTQYCSIQTTRSTIKISQLL